VRRTIHQKTPQIDAEALVKSIMDQAPKPYDPRLRRAIP
jgi:hypothetical protein